jgi:hypothetical protein
VLNALTELHAAGMLSPKDGGAICRHDTIREAVLERTPTAARVLLHRRAARTIGSEALREGGVTLLWESVHHWRSAGAANQGTRLTLLLAKRLLSLGLAKDGLAVLEELEGRATLDLRQRLRTLRGRARAARMLRDWTKLQKVVAQWRGAFTTEGRLPPTHSAMELLDFEAQYNDFTSFGHLPAEIDACVSETTASVAHRLSAAALSMIRADNEGDDEVARRIFRAIEQLQPSSKRERIASLTTQAVYHASFGDLAKTPVVLLQLAQEALTLSHPVLRALHVRRAAFGLARYGTAADARELLVQCLDTFERLQLHTQALYCIEELGLLALWEGSFDEVMAYSERSRSIHAVTHISYGKAIECELRALLAFESEDSSVLPTFSMPLDVASALQRSKRGKQALLTVDLILDVFKRDRSLLMTHLHQLHGLYNELRCRGYQDQVVAVLSAAMLEIGLEREAHLLVSAYANGSRRELKSPSRKLQRIISTSISGSQSSQFS